MHTHIQHHISYTLWYPHYLLLQSSQHHTNMSSIGCVYNGHPSIRHIRSNIVDITRTCTVHTTLRILTHMYKYRLVLCLHIIYCIYTILLCHTAIPCITVSYLRLEQTTNCQISLAQHRRDSEWSTWTIHLHNWKSNNFIIVYCSPWCKIENQKAVHNNYVCVLHEWAYVHTVM